MFKGKLSILKNIVYLMILGLHSFLFAIFIYNKLPDYLITLISSISIASLMILGVYSFLTTKPYYFYFYIGIVVCSIPLIVVSWMIMRIFFYLIITFVVPEVIILGILLLNGLNQGSVYYKMRVNKNANVFQHDPAVTSAYGSVSRILAFKMDEVWNPDSSLPLKSEDKLLEKKTFSTKVQLLCFLLTLVSFISIII